MVQSFNKDAIFRSIQIWMNPNLLIPHRRIKNITQLSFDELKRKGIQAVVFDKDNTLTLPYVNEIYPPFQASVDSCFRVFGQEKMYKSYSLLGYIYWSRLVNCF